MPAVHLGVDPADEERGHAGHVGEVVRPRGGQRLEAGEVGLDDLVVAVDAEDERHVDAAALADHLPDGGDALRGGRDLDQHVGLVDALVEAAGGGDGALGVVGQGRRHLHRDEAVAARRRRRRPGGGWPGRR